MTDLAKQHDMGGPGEVREQAPSDVVADVGTFYDLFNDFLNQEFALTLGDFAETHCREFQTLVNEQVSCF